MREAGYPAAAIPYLERSVQLEPNNITGYFNLAVCYLLLGDYARGWPAYEARWRYEHLAGLLPNWPNQWQGEDLKGKTILILGEQGFGDTVQFIRFAANLVELGARVVAQVPTIVVPLLNGGGAIAEVAAFDEPTPAHDYWIPIMSIPRILKLELNNLQSPISYIAPHPTQVAAWRQRLGPKLKLRIGLGWSGRRDTWINQHKAVPFELIRDMVARHPEYQWVNLQVDCTNEEGAELERLGVATFPGTIRNMADSASLMANMDVVIGVDTAVSHLAAALGRPTWIMLNRYGVDWRWLLDRSDSPWYPTARLFRQKNYHDWTDPIAQVEHQLSLFKV